MIIDAYSLEMREMAKWQVKIENNDLTREQIVFIAKELEAKTREARALVDKLYKTERIEEDKYNEFQVLLGPSDHHMTASEYIEYLEEMVQVRAIVEDQDSLTSSTALQSDLQMELPQIQAEIERLLAQNIGDPDVPEDDENYSPLLREYKKMNLGKINTAGTSGVGMLFWALAAGEVPAVRMLVDLKQSKEGGRLEYLTLSASEVMANRFNAFITKLDTLGDVDEKVVFDLWSELIQEVMIVAGFNYQLLVQHGKKGVSYTTTVTAGADKWRERALDLLTKALNPELNALYYVPHQFSFVHANSANGDANRFYSVPAPEKRVRTSVGALYDHAKGNEHVALRYRIVPQPEDLQTVSTSLGYGEYDKTTPEQHAEIQAACEGLLSNRADEITKWQVFAHSVTKVTPEIIATACADWNATTESMRSSSKMTFLDFLMRRTTGSAAQNISFSGSRVN